MPWQQDDHPSDVVCRMFYVYRKNTMDIAKTLNIKEFEVWNHLNEGGQKWLKKHKK
jgi:hypothetical protein